MNEPSDYTDDFTHRLMDWLKAQPGVEVPESLRGFTIVCEMRELPRIEWRTMVLPKPFFAPKKLVREMERRMSGKQIGTLFGYPIVETDDPALRPSGQIYFGRPISDGGFNVPDDKLPMLKEMLLAGELSLASVEITEDFLTEDEWKAARNRPINRKAKRAQRG